MPLLTARLRRALSQHLLSVFLRRIAYMMLRAAIGDFLQPVFSLHIVLAHAMLAFEVRPTSRKAAKSDTSAARVTRMSPSAGFAWQPRPNIRDCPAEAKH